MIETYCACKKPIRAAESAIGSSVQCAACGVPVTFVSAEAMESGQAVGDFDARLIITLGPAGVGQVLALGGVPELEIGKSPDRHIILPGTMVSRAHAKLSRLDFGPSRWQITDTNSRNGLFVNDRKFTETELVDGDRVRIGEFELLFTNYAPEPVVQAVVAEAPGTIINGIPCPGCKKMYPVTTKICGDCGINIKTGRPLVISRGLDEDDLAVRTDTWVRLISWLLWFGLFPIASEAFGTKKAKSIWWIAGITIAASALFFIPYYTGGSSSDGCKPWVMWAGTANGEAQRLQSSLRHKISRDEASDEEIQEAVSQMMARQGEFHAYQLITQALIHAGFMHLAGNMVFMIVFGLRVNELIGNLLMAIVYPILAVSSALIYLIASSNDPLHASLGASGAIMGLAGMYFVFFPVQKVVMVIWFRGGLLTGWRVLYKTFRMSGFWLLVLWIGFNDVLPTVLHGTESGDGVAHWAHLGGFISGVVLALGLLIGRQVSAHGSDVLSMALGPTAWKLIGKPTTN